MATLADISVAGLPAGRGDATCPVAATPDLAQPAFFKRAGRAVQPPAAPCALT